MKVGGSCSVAIKKRVYTGKIAAMGKIFKCRTGKNFRGGKFRR